MPASTPVQIDVWSDVVCPWCYIGKRRLERAIERFDGGVEVRWHSFQLDPTHPKGLREPVPDMMQRKLGAPPAQVKAMIGQVTELAAAEGLTYAFDRAIAANTLDAHRLTHLASKYELGEQLHERLMRAYVSEAAVVDDHETLVRLASEVGIDADEAQQTLAGDAFLAEVEADISLARRLGITGVPFFVVNDRYGISGAQPVETFLAGLETVAAEGGET